MHIRRRTAPAVAPDADPIPDKNRGRANGERHRSALSTPDARPLDSRQLELGSTTRPDAPESARGSWARRQCGSPFQQNVSASSILRNRRPNGGKFPAKPPARRSRHNRRDRNERPRTGRAPPRSTPVSAAALGGSRSSSPAGFPDTAPATAPARLLARER